MPVLELPVVARPPNFVPKGPAPTALVRALTPPIAQPVTLEPSKLAHERQEWNAGHGRRMRAVEALLCASVLAYFAVGLLGTLGWF